MPSEAVSTELEMSSQTVIDVNQSTSSALVNNCIILGMNTTIPWDNPHNLISLEAEFLFDKIKATILIPLLFLIGFPANCINMVVFFKQGLAERINMCLFSLALVDLIYLSAIFVLYAERIYTQFTGDERYGPVLRYMVHNHVIVLFGFGYVHLFLVAVVATERCICVLFPMTAQRCIPTKTLVFVIVVSGSVLVCLRVAIVSQYQITCFYEMQTHRVSWQLYVNDYYFQNEAMISVLNGVFYGFCLTVGCPTIVLIATIITAVRLTHIVRWRSQTSSSLSSKEIGLTKMLIALSIEFIIICIPVITIRVSPLFEPRLGAGGDFANTFNLLISTMEICSYVNSTANFFMYVFTGTKYRNTFRSLFIKKTCKNLGPTTTVTNATAPTELSAVVTKTTVQVVEDH